MTLRSQKHLLLLSAFLVLCFTPSCSKHGRSTNISTDASTVDCTGFTSEMIIPYGLTIGHAAGYANKTFAKLTAVDKGTGQMEITIGPSSSGAIPLDFIDNFKDYKLRLIACRENVNAITGGISTSRACSTLGSINLIGAEDLKSDDFVDGYYTVNSIKVHATTDPVFNSGKSLLRPDFIMLTAGLIDANPYGEFMIAYGKSPYYNGCYPKNE